jgi:hypothetical protein
VTTRRLLVTHARVIGCLLGLALAAPVPGFAATDWASLRGSLAGLGVPFLANQGQVDGQVAYYAPTVAGPLFVTQGGELVYKLATPRARTSRERSRTPAPGWTLTETFVAGAAIRPLGLGRSPTGASVFIGNDRTRWRTALPTFAQLDLGEIWPGVRVTLRARGEGVEKIFTLEPGVPAGRISVRMDGADALSVDAGGALVASTGFGRVTFTAPLAYQERDGVRRQVTAAYRLTGRDYGFTVGAHDPTLPLVIDPLLQSTYLGGSLADQALAVAIHPVSGDVYVAGSTASTDFPGTAGGSQALHGGGDTDAFVARLNAGLTTLVQATYLGGNALDSAATLAIHPATGDVYVAGLTASGDFPGTAGGAQPMFSGGEGLGSASGDGFVARLDSALTVLVQTTYFGDTNVDEAVAGLAIHPASGDVYIAGGRYTNAALLTFQTDAFVARLNAALTAVVDATFFGRAVGEESGASAIAIHPATGEVYVAGRTAVADLPGTAGGAQPMFGGGIDAFVARFSPELTAPIQSTYLGGGGAEFGNAVAISVVTGDLYVAGNTDSVDFPATAGGANPTKSEPFVIEPFVARLNAHLTAITQATYLGGSAATSGRALAIQSLTGDVYVGGSTQADDIPGTAGGAQPTKPGAVATDDGYVVRLTGDLTRTIQATYVGGSGSDAVFGLAVHPMTADVYVAGGTGSSDFPGTAGGARVTPGGSEDAFVSRLTFGLAAVDPRFADVSPFHPLFAWIEALGQAAVTGGCASAPPRYCSEGGVTRAHMAVFLVRAIHGGGFEPPAPTGMFADVPVSHPLVRWIEQLARDGVTAGCATAPLLYCPDAVVTRAQLAAFLVRAEHGPGFDPPSGTGTMFIDVPPFHPFSVWIEQAAREGIATGCQTQRYCPDGPVTRGQMAVFLARAFNLPM